MLGPIFVLKASSSPKELRRKIVAELWLYPDDSRLLELSTKCAPSEAFQVAAETRAFLAERGIDMSGRAGDEDPQGARVLLGAARGRGDAGDCAAAPPPAEAARPTGSC